MTKHFVFLLFITAIFFFNSCSDTASAGKDTDSPKTEFPEGMELYKSYCRNCHGNNGDLGFSGSAKLTRSTLSREEVITLVTNGKGLMNSYQNILSEKEIEQVVDYVISLRSQ